MDDDDVFGEDSGRVICDRCNGSGEGMTDGSVCSTCRGSGEIEEGGDDGE